MGRKWRSRSTFGRVPEIGRVVHALGKPPALTLSAIATKESRPDVMALFRIRGRVVAAERVFGGGSGVYRIAGRAAARKQSSNGWTESNRRASHAS